MWVSLICDTGIQRIIGFLVTNDTISDTWHTFRSLSLSNVMADDFCLVTVAAFINIIEFTLPHCALMKCVCFSICRVRNLMKHINEGKKRKIRFQRCNIEVIQRECFNFNPFLNSYVQHMPLITNDTFFLPRNASTTVSVASKKFRK